MIPSLSRRTFLKAGSIAATAAALPWRPVRAIPIWTATIPPDFSSAVSAALDAAKRAGATYADAHVRLSRIESWPQIMGKSIQPPTRQELTSFGLRALVNGYWGFAGMDGLVTTDAAARLGQSAAALARRAAQGPPRVVELAPTPVVTGTWTMPVAVDPLTVPYEEKVDFLWSLADLTDRDAPRVGVGGALEFVRDERLFASSEGSSVQQTCYRSTANLSFSVPADWHTEQLGNRTVDCVSIGGAGWEYLYRAPFREQLPRLAEQAYQQSRAKPVTIGRYDVVFDAPAMASIIDSSITPATELDRAMGLESNDLGTSYLNDPLTMLGAFQLGSPQLTITMNRSMPGGAATVQWDSEGVVPPQDVPLITKGIVTDFQTTRESASWLAPYYTRVGRPVRSNGGAGAYGATTPVTQWNPNLVMAPGRDTLTFDDLVKQVKKGYAVLGGYAKGDSQGLNGSVQGQVVYEVTDGKLGDTINNAEFAYRAPEFWRNLAAVGGPGSAHTTGILSTRGAREDRAAYSISAVPGLVTGVAVTDSSRMR